jgi:hypothetical protein
VLVGHVNTLTCIPTFKGSAVKFCKSSLWAASHHRPQGRETCQAPEKEALGRERVLFVYGELWGSCLVFSFRRLGNDIAIVGTTTSKQHHKELSLEELSNRVPRTIRRVCQPIKACISFPRWMSTLQINLYGHPCTVGDFLIFHMRLHHNQSDTGLCTVTEKVLIHFSLDYAEPQGTANSIILNVDETRDYGRTIRLYTT